MDESKMTTSMWLPDFELWQKTAAKRLPISFDLEITARCNNNCRHCYINLPTADKTAKEEELSLDELKSIIDEIASHGGLWCLITGGEPLLREDFEEIYLYLKKKGFLVTLFTNATLITDKHIQLLKKYPPRDIEVSVYGVTQETYERVTRRVGSFSAFMRGLNLLLENNIKVRFKAMALKSNVHELPEIAKFCRERTKDYFRFDPLLHLRLDRNPIRNEEIKSERLSPEEIARIEYEDEERFSALVRGCNDLIFHDTEHVECFHIFRCGIGKGSFTLGYDGKLRLCPSLSHPDLVYDLRKGSFSEAWERLYTQIRSMTSQRKEFVEHCRVCPIINLCLWCPAHAYLEVGELDTKVDYFCEVAHARYSMLEKNANTTKI